MGVKIEIDVKDKHSIVIREYGDLWLLVEAADEIQRAVSSVIGQYESVFTKLGGSDNASSD